MTQVELLCWAANCNPEDLPNLQTLYAWNSEITDAGLAHVPNLQTLYAWNSKITDAGKKLIHDRKKTK
jgi:Leucine-rich repeat (LRR) protein